MFQCLDLQVLHQTTKFCYWYPLNNNNNNEVVFSILSHLLYLVRANRIININSLWPDWLNGRERGRGEMEEEEQHLLEE